jgi:hypothetical protein
VSDRVVTVPPTYHGSSRYWLVTLEPKRADELILHYSFEQSNSGYQAGERSYLVRVGPKGCQRELVIGTYRESASPDLCLGDRLVVPIALQDNYANYQFSNHDSTIREAYGQPSARPPNPINPSPVQTPIAAWLAYRGRHFEMASTAGGDRMVTWHAHWQAIDPGRWNVGLAMQPSPELQALAEVTADPADEYSTRVSGPDDETVQAIVVLPANQSLSVLPRTMLGRNYNRTGPYANSSSSVSDRFPVGQLVLRVGDRFQIPYGGARISRSSLPSMNWQAQQAELDRLAALANHVLVQQKPFAPPALESPTSERYPAQRHFFDDWLVP